MPIEQMNISLSPQMARFIRSKVKKGEYTNASEVVRDGVRRLQQAEASQRERSLLAGYEGGLTKLERQSIAHGVKQGIRDMEEGHYEGYDADGLRGLAKELVATSARKTAGRSKRGR